MCKVPIKIQSTVDDQYLDFSGEFVSKENQRTRFYAEIVDEDSGNYKFRIVDGKGRALEAKQKKQQLAWTRTKNNGAVWSLHKLPGGDIGYLMTDTCLCLKHSPDKVYLDRCPVSKSTAACPDYIFKISFKFDKRKLDECRMALAATKNCKGLENEKTVADCARTCCRSRIKSRVRAKCSNCKNTACCKEVPSTIRMIKARKALGESPSECNKSADKCDKPSAVSRVPTSVIRPEEAPCGCTKVSTDPKVGMLLEVPGDGEELSEPDGDRKAEEKKRKSSLQGSIRGGPKQGGLLIHRDEEMPGGRQYLMLNSLDRGSASGGRLDSTAVKEISNAIGVLNGDKGKSAQTSLESVKDALIKNLSSETLESMAKEKRKLEEDAALKIGVLSKHLAESRGEDGFSKTSSQEKKSSAENVLETMAKAVGDTRETRDKTIRRINSAADELENISKVLDDRETKKKGESVMDNVGEIASLAKSLAPPQVALATGILSKLGV